MMQIVLVFCFYCALFVKFCEVLIYVVWEIVFGFYLCFWFRDWIY